MMKLVYKLTTTLRLNFYSKLNIMTRYPRLYQTAEKILIIFFIGLTIYSCNSVKKINNDRTNEVWEKGIITISGTIIEIRQEKDGQTIMLEDKNGNLYNCILSISNLGDKQFQYRTFNIGEDITFRGNLSQEMQLTVREILENR